MVKKGSKLGPLLLLSMGLLLALQASWSRAAGQATFDDVPVGHPYFFEIEALYQAGYTSGCSTDPPRYCPDETMIRAESAVFVERGIHGADFEPAPPAASSFADVPAGYWGEGWIESLWEDGYTAGCGTNPLVYCPLAEHTRAEGCVFYLRMLNGPDYQPPASNGVFADVPDDWWGAGWVEAAVEAGLIEPCDTEPELRFCPHDPLTRGLAAYMMVQAKELPLPTPVPSPTPTQIPTGDPPCGLFHVSLSDESAVRETGSDLVLFIARPGQQAQWRTQLEALRAMGVQVVLEIYPQPWSLSGGQWTFTEEAAPFMDLALEYYNAGVVHSVKFMEEPYAHGYTTAQIQSLYTALKDMARVPLFITFGSFKYWEDAGDQDRLVAPGMCDYCASGWYPFRTSTVQWDRYRSKIEAETDILRRRAPDSQFVLDVQTFAQGDMRMPTYDELIQAYEIAIEYEDVTAILYYCHQKVATSYTDWLANHPELWGAVCPDTGSPPGLSPTKNP